MNISNAGGGAPTDLEGLMADYQRDEAAAVELVRRVSPRIRAFFCRTRLTRPYADDLVQECWLHIHKSRASYRHGMKVLPWVFGIACHTRVDGYRELRRTRVLSTVSLEAVMNTIACPEAWEPELDAKRLLARLPEGQRKVVSLLKIVGMTVDEVALATGSSPGAVKQKAHRAYRNLRTMANAGSAADKGRNEGDGRR